MMKNLNDMTDEELAVSYANGNHYAFDLLLKHNQQRVFGYILCMVHDYDLANDLFQETFIKVIVKLQKGKYAPCGSLAAWLLRVAHNVIIDWFRTQKNSKIACTTLVDDLQGCNHQNMKVADIEEIMVKNQSAADLHRLIAKLPLAQQEVVYMYYFQGFSFKEIAQISGVSINTSLGRMRYALQNLRKMISRYSIALKAD